MSTIGIFAWPSGDIIGGLFGESLVFGVLDGLSGGTLAFDVLGGLFGGSLAFDVLGGLFGDLQVHGTNEHSGE